MTIVEVRINKHTQSKIFCFWIKRIIKFVMQKHVFWKYIFKLLEVSKSIKGKIHTYYVKRINYNETFL